MYIRIEGIIDFPYEVKKFKTISINKVKLMHLVKQDLAGKEYEIIDSHESHKRQITPQFTSSLGQFLTI